MARPRGFDENTVLDAAIDRFWADGYAATSVRNLGAAMGLGTASLYNGFGDKRGLFIRALDRYLDRTMRALITRIEHTLPPRAAIGACLEHILETSLDDPRGCLLINTATELAAHDPDIGQEVASRFHELEAFFCRAIESGQRDGSIRPEPCAADLARLLVAVVIGMRVLARSRPDAELLRGASRQAMAALGPCPPPR
ncbi:MAG: TetR/AcrR family transcriptional regulator [Rhodospirillales bacterium]|nr:TetR/AcrR family transcriptional regulator [Rhodospirillales bacterium]